MGHLFNGNGQVVTNLYTSISRKKEGLYVRHYHARGYDFAALPVSTLLGLGPEVCHLFHRLASAPSETCLDRSGQPVPWTDNGDPGNGIRYCHLVREFQHSLALATLLRLRGKDAFISGSDVPV